MIEAIILFSCLQRTGWMSLPVMFTILPWSFFFPPKNLNLAYSYNSHCQFNRISLLLVAITCSNILAILSVFGETLVTFQCISSKMYHPEGMNSPQG